MDTKLREIFLKTFNNSEVPLDLEGLILGDIDEWDSLGNFNLLLAIEEEFSIRFSMEEMSEMKSVQEIKEVLISKNL